MGSQNKVVALLFAVVLACTSLVASAQQVDTSLSANSTATISAIDSIGTPLSNQAASEVRGELFVIPWVVVEAVFYGGVALGIAYNRLYPYAMYCYQNCNSAYELYDWYNQAITQLRN